MAALPWLSLGFLLTGCPLSDKYSLSEATSGGAGDDGGGGAFAGSTSGGSGGAAGDASGGNSALAGSLSGGSQNAGSSGNSGANATAGAGAADAGLNDGGAEAGQGPSGGAAGAGAGSSGDGGTSGFSGAGGASGCSTQTCTHTCCALSGDSSTMSCADTTRDFENCGSCGTLCNMGRSCNSSSCTPGWVGMAPPPVGFSARSRAAAVALGKSVFIWGGSDSSGAVLDSGAIYSPATDSWTPLPKDASTPTARVLASAVWTGSVVLVFGGSDATGSVAYKDGALYDPAKNAWTALPAVNKGRSAALGYWDGTRALFWGGVGSGGMPASGADRFDLTTWAASTLTGDPGALSNPASGWDGNALYLEGGLSAGVRSDKVFSYNSNTDTWAALSKSLTARSNAFGVWDGSRFVVWGGRDDAVLRNDGKYQLGVTWFTISALGAPSARMLVPRRHGWCFQTSPGLIALVGGQSSLTGLGTFSTTGASYDVISAKWTSIPSFPSGETHDYGVGVWTGEEFVLWSGKDGAASTLTGERWKP